MTTREPSVTESVAPPVQPFLKWPGGKRWLAAPLADVLRPHLTGEYIEPFLGSGAVFLALSPAQAHLSDVNQSLLECIDAVSRDTEAVLQAVWRFSNTEACYYRVRAMRPRTHITRAARFIYLNRTCWGGVYRLNRKGEFNTPYGNSGRPICPRALLEAPSRVFARARLQCTDFEQVVCSASAGDVVYADPPYVSRDEDSGFRRYTKNVFGWRDHVRLASAARMAADAGAVVAVSLPWDRGVLDLYRGWLALRLARHSCLARTATSRRPVSEALVFSRPIDLQAPLVVEADAMLRLD